MRLVILVIFISSAPGMIHVSSTLYLINLELLCPYRQIINFDGLPEVNEYSIIPGRINDIRTG